MIRRKFLGLLGIGAAAGPKTLADLSVGDVKIQGQLPTFYEGGFSSSSSVLAITEARERAKAKLADFLTNDEKRAKRRKRVAIEEIDVDLAAHRSMSLVRKIQIMRDRQFEAFESIRHQRLLNQVLGIEADD